LIAGEGGLIATNDRALAEHLRIGRDYGNPGDYDTRFVGLNARMSELHAAVALESLVDFDRSLERRQTIAERYRSSLKQIPGIAVQEVRSGDRSTYKDLTIRVESEQFGMSRDRLVTALAAERIDTRKYFCPPVHLQQAYVTSDPVKLPVTERVAAEVVSLPMWPDLPLETVDLVVDVVAALQRRAEEVAAAAA
jgi:dTDP-4-amino-4,6-dideoxygalactose transaminase